MDQNFTRFAFTDSVKAAQTRYGSRHSYERMEHSGDRFILTDREIPFITSRDSFFVATVGENGWPYMQFRGGPKGFLKVLDDWNCPQHISKRFTHEEIQAGVEGLDPDLICSCCPE